MRLSSACFSEMATALPKKIAISFGKKPVPKTSSGIKRPAAALHDSEDEEEVQSGIHQEISAFDHSAGGAVHSSQPESKKQLLVIPALPNHDRLEYGRKRQRSDLPQENVDVTIAKKEVTFGLLVPDKKTKDAQIIVNPVQITDEADPDPKSDDQIALDALLGKSNGSVKTIPFVDENEAFARDMDEAVEVPTLEQYLAIPPSDFGAACLRGMGWKDTETLGLAGASEHIIKPRTTERRAALLGVGAKPSAALGIEIGEWGKSAGRNKKKAEEVYVPVVLKNKNTGEIITEQELKSKLVDQAKDSTELVFEQKSERSSTRREDDQYWDNDRYKKRDKYESDSRRHRDFKSSRSDSRDRSKRRSYESKYRYDDKDDGHRKSDIRKDRESGRDQDRYRDDRNKYDRNDKRDQYRKDREEKSHDDKNYRYGDVRNGHDQDDKYISSSRKHRDGNDRDRGNDFRR